VMMMMVSSWGGKTIILGIPSKRWLSHAGVIVLIAFVKHDLLLIFFLDYVNIFIFLI